METDSEAKGFKEYAIAAPSAGGATAPIGFVDEDSTVKHITTAMELGHNIGLRGKTGTGKTYLVRELARVSKRKLWTLNMTVNTTVDEVKGSYVLKPGPGGVMVGEWHNGSLVQAMLAGDWVVIEEANFMRDELASVFYSVMDDRRELILDEHEGEIIKAAAGFRLFLTMNWDYKGTNRPNDAILNRINSWFDIEYLQPPKEAALLASRTGIPLDVANKMAMFASKIRATAEKENMPDLSTRILLNWAQTIKSGLSPVEAAEMSVVPILGYSFKEKDPPRTLLGSFFNVRKRGDDDDD